MGLPSVIEAALLPGLIGWGRTREMLLTGAMYSARRGAGHGLRAEGGAGGGARCGGRAAGSTASAGPRPRRCASQKALMNRWERVSIDEGIYAGIDALSDAYKTGEPQAAIKAFFEGEEVSTLTGLSGHCSLLPAPRRSAGPPVGLARNRATSSRKNAGRQGEPGNGGSHHAARGTATMRTDHVGPEDGAEPGVERVAAVERIGRQQVEDQQVEIGRGQHGERQRQHRPADAAAPRRPARRGRSHRREIDRRAGQIDHRAGEAPSAAASARTGRCRRARSARCATRCAPNRRPAKAWPSSCSRIDSSRPTTMTKPADIICVLPP